jgi:Fe-S cluster assembly ATPase SufC
MGDTGAGKSTTLNAILGEESILPTNGMRACTAVIIEMRHSRQTDTHKYIGEVEFLTREEWNKELDILISDMKAEDGRMIKKPDPRSQAGIALAKIKVKRSHVIEFFSHG